jgi:sugar phosphate permease
MALAAICIGYLAPNYAQYQLSPLAGSLMEELSISASQFSSLFTAPMIPAIFLSLVAGILVDKHNPRLVVGIAFVISTIGAALNLAGNSYGTLFLGFALTGVAAAFLNSCGAKLLGSWYPPEQLSSKLGIGFAFSTLAMTVALATTAYFPNRHSAFAVALVVFVASTIGWFALYRNPEPVADSGSSAPAAGEKGEQPGLGALLKRVMSSSGVWLVGLALFCVMGANVVMSSFVPTILQSRGIDAVASGYYSSAYTIGNLVSCIVVPMVAQKAGTKRTVLVLDVCAFLLVAFGWMAPDGFLLAAALFLAGFFLGGNMPILQSVPIKLAGIGPELAGTAGGLVATVELLGAVFLPSYVLIPAAGGNLATAFVLAGVCMLVSCALTRPLPKEV